MYFLMFVGVLCLSLFCYTLLCVNSSFAIILKRRRKLAVLLLLSYRCIITINDLQQFLTVHWVGLQCVIVVFLDQTHLLFMEPSVAFYKGNLLIVYTAHIFLTLFSLTLFHE